MNSRNKNLVGEIDDLERDYRMQLELMFTISKSYMKKNFN